MARTPSTRRLARTEVVFRTASGGTLIATAPSGRPPRRLAGLRRRTVARAA
jgi:hypothetical protein